MMLLVRGAALALGILLPTVMSATWVSSAGDRLAAPDRARVAGAEAPPVATAADEQYCTPELKKILRRVLQSCGLLGASSSRGCQPLEARNVATVSGEEFNALFQPMKERGGIVQYDQGGAELDASDRAVIDEVFSDQRGASYFFVVARASPEGSVARNRELSRGRAEEVMSHLQKTFQDPDLEREVGLLWLGEEFAQLDREFCQWKRSGSEQSCDPRDINRSAFIAWIDCRL